MSAFSSSQQQKPLLTSRCWSESNICRAFSGPTSERLSCQITSVMVFSYTGFCPSLCCVIWPLSRRQSDDALAGTSSVLGQIFLRRGSIPGSSKPDNLRRWLNLSYKESFVIARRWDDEAVLMVSSNRLYILVIGPSVTVALYPTWTSLPLV